MRVAWLNSYAHKDGTLGHRLLLGSSEHSLQLLQVMTSLIASLMTSLMTSLIASLMTSLRTSAEP